MLCVLLEGVDVLSSVIPIPPEKRENKSETLASWVAPECDETKGGI